MYRKILSLIVTMAATCLFAQSTDTIYMYETLIEHDTLVTRDTTYIHDTIHLAYHKQKSIAKKGHREKKNGRKELENSPLQEELFQGLHIGYTGQFDLMMPAQVTEDPHLMGVPYVGGHAGLEFSWHFARWLGVSAALNYGTTGALRFKYEWQDGNLETIKRNYTYGTGLSFPVKFEFHYPVSPNAWVVADAGVRIRMPWNTFIYGYNPDHSDLDSEYHLQYVESLSEDNPLILNYNYIDRDILNLDILTGVGMYFRLRNNDLFRWNVGYNIALREFAIGSFTHRIYNTINDLLPPDDPYEDILGEFSLRSHFFYAQVAYIHTFSKSKHRSETAPYALKYGNNKMYNHEFKLEVSDWFGVLFMQTHWLHFPTGSEESYDSPKKVSPVISGSYYYRVTPWFWVGLSMNYAHYTKNIKVRYAWDDPSAMRVEGTRTYHLLGIMPGIRFSYFNRPHVTLYSGLSVGVDLHISGKYEGGETYKDYYPDPLFYSAFQATLFGVKAGGKHWFGSFELGAGYKGIAALGVGYEF